MRVVVSLGSCLLWHILGDAGVLSTDAVPGAFYLFIFYVYWEGKVLNYMYPTSIYREEGYLFWSVSPLDTCNPFWPEFWLVFRLLACVLRTPTFKVSFENAKGGAGDLHELGEAGDLHRFGEAGDLHQFGEAILFVGIVRCVWPSRTKSVRSCCVS
jgi:hypothetical protein